MPRVLHKRWSAVWSVLTEGLGKKSNGEKVGLALQIELLQKFGLKFPYLAAGFLERRSPST